MQDQPAGQSPSQVLVQTFSPRCAVQIDESQSSAELQGSPKQPSPGAQGGGWVSGGAVSAAHVSPGSSDTCASAWPVSSGRVSGSVTTPGSVPPQATIQSPNVAIKLRFDMSAFPRSMLRLR